MDVAHSVIFNYSLQMAMPAAPTPQATAQASSQTLEGLWWKQEANVTGFVALTNPGSQAISASLVTSDSLGDPLGQNAVTVSPHGTKMVSLSLSPQSAGAAGGLRVVYTGSPNDLLVSGGLRDDATGYSANISFAQPPSGTAQGSTVSAAAIGLMTGAADPMLSFPAGTVFTPYAVVRNISSQALSFTPNFWWMAGGVAKNAALSQVSLAPYQALNLDVLSLLAQAGLKNYNGSVNLVLNINANSPRGAMLFSTGSVDQKNTYVFQVNPGNVKESIAKNLSYWSTANGDDTMVTLWNPADEAQDFLFTLFYSGGHYKYPLHLEPRATSMFNVSEILHSAIPDADGNVIPAGIQEGSAELAGSQGEAQHILVSMDTGTYNVQKAICGTHCVTCQGAVNSWVTDSPFAVAVNGTHQLTFTVQNHSGSQYNDTGVGSWSSTNTSVATVSSGLVNGIVAGSLDANVVDDGYPLYATQCFPAGVTTDCPIATGTSGGSPGTTADSTPVITGIDPADWVAGTAPQVTFTGMYFGTNAPTLGFSPGAGISYSLVSYTDAKIVANVTVASGTPNEDVDVTVTNNGYGGQSFNGGSVGASATSVPVNASVHAPTGSPEVTVIAWINPNAPDLQILPSGANQHLVTNLNTSPSTCGAELAAWSAGVRTDLLNFTDQDYANGWLVKFSANTAPPSTIIPSNQLSGGNFRMMNDFGGSGSGIVQLGVTPDPCGLVPPNHSRLDSQRTAQPIQRNYKHLSFR